VSTKLPAVEGGRLVRALRRAGFHVSTVVGSHHVMPHRDGRRTTIAVHSGRTVKRGTLMAILRDVNLSPDDLRRLL